MRGGSSNNASMLRGDPFKNISKDCLHCSQHVTWQQRPQAGDVGHQKGAARRQQHVLLVRQRRGFRVTAVRDEPVEQVDRCAGATSVVSFVYVWCLSSIM